MKTAQQWGDEIVAGDFADQTWDETFAMVQRDALESAAEIADDSLLQNDQIAAAIRRLKPT